MHFKNKFFLIFIIITIFTFVGCTPAKKNNLNSANNNTKPIETQSNSTVINETSEKDNSNNTLAPKNEQNNSNASINSNKPTSSKKVSTSKNTQPKPSKNKPNNKTTKLIGFVGKVYDNGGKKYLTFDNVKFLTGKAAIEAAKKDGAAQKDENGKYYVWDDYYIVNREKQFKTYCISENSTFNLCIYLLKSPGKYSNASITQKTTYSKFKSSANESSILCYITIKNNEIIDITQQYIP